MNKKICAMAILIIMCGMITVSAASFEQEDFGNFTMDVPSNANFEEKTVIPAGTVFTFSGGSMSSSINEVASDPEKTHPMWIDEDINLSIEYIIFSEDNYTDCDDAMEKLYNGSTKKESINGVTIYTLDPIDRYDYAVCKVSDGFLFTSGDEMVIVSGNKLGELKQIAASTEFK